MNHEVPQLGVSTSPSRPADETGPARTKPAVTRALGKTTVLETIVAAASIVLVTRRFGSMQVIAHPQAPWWLLALGFAGAELIVFHIEVRREAITFSLSELPMTLGLFFASPTALVVGRVVGSMSVLILHERQSVRKLVLNLAMFSAECVTAVVVFRGMPLSHEVNRPASWVAVLLAVTASSATAFAMVVMAMRWHGAPMSLKKTAVTNSITGVTNSALAVLTAVLVTRNPAALGLLALVGVMIVAAYRGYSSLSARYASLRLLYEFTRLVSGSQRPDAVLESILKEARQLLRAEKAAIALESNQGTVSLWLEDGGGVGASRRPLPIDMLRGVVSTGRAVVADRHTKYADRRVLLDALGAKDCIVAPIIENSRPIGVLLVINRETEVSTFDAEDGRLFETLANHASVALENGRLIERLDEEARQREHEALHDSLTGLPNRAFFLKELTRTIASTSATDGSQLTVALLDLDHFKEINDTLGHHHGDLLLREVTERLRASLPSSTMLARLGGDEFAVFSANETADEASLDLRVIIQNAFSQPFIVEGFALEIGASTGIALYPDHGVDPSTLLKRADVAMYDAKTSATSGIETYDSARDINTPRRLALANDLRRAIETAELELHYQPKARVRDGLIIGAEGLIRWRHPQHGNVPPDEFVPLAERTGLIQPFTQFVIAHGLSTLHSWSSGGLALGLSLNLSVRNLLDVALPEHVGQVLASIGVDPSTLTFEVTETGMMAEPTKALRTLQRLAEIGVRLSIDDFGTGHSSLAYIQRLPVHEVKIDRSFIVPLATAPATRAIVQSIIHLAHSLGLTVVAEGVEEEETWHELAQLGCDEIQGYYLCRPLPEPQLQRWLTEQAPAGTFNPTKTMTTLTRL